MKFLRLGSTFLLSLMSLASAGILCFLAYRLYSDGQGVNYGLVAAAVMALVFTLVTNPLSSNLLGFKGRIVRTLLTQSSLVLLGVGALFGAYQLYDQSLAKRNETMNVGMAENALPRAMETCRRVAKGDATSREIMDCDGWFIRARSLQEYYDQKEYVLLLVLKGIADGVTDGDLVNSITLDWIDRCETDEILYCAWLGESYTNYDPNHPAAALVRYACEQGYDGGNTRSCEVYILDGDD